jgi:site-specific DNA-adenine methylase
MIEEITKSFPTPPDWWAQCVRDSELIESTIFPYFGGKSKVVDLVWERFGNVVNYVEPYFGSGIMLRSRPHEPTIETVNDISAHLANVWRAIKWHPEATAEWSDWPVNEVDLHARHAYLVKHEPELREKLNDPDFCDPKLAGWWIWGICAWIGSGWCVEYGATKKGRAQQMPMLAGGGADGTQIANYGRCINSKSMRGLSKQLPDIGSRKPSRLPMLGAGSGGEDDHACAHHGRGVHSTGLSQQMPHLGGGNNNHGQGVHNSTNRTRLYDVFAAISRRFRNVRITCGDAMRVLSDSITWRHGITGVFLDPPYPGDAGSTAGIYTNAKSERETFDDAFRYCVENGSNKSLRIALCYYDGTEVPIAYSIQHRTPSHSADVSHELRSLGWEIVEWKAGSGYGGQTDKAGKKNENRHRERIAFSPHCLRSAQGSLF